MLWDSGVWVPSSCCCCLKISMISMAKVKPLLSRALILGIETSCDDTCIALIDGGARKIIGNVRYSQHHVHQGSQGIVPFTAQKHHSMIIPMAFQQLEKQVGFPLNSPANVDLISVTNGPGLALSLLVGLNFAKELSIASGIPLVGVHHMAGHALMARMMHEELEFPYLSLLLSGGHTLLLKVQAWNKFTIIGTSVDDCIGEALDKGCRTLGIPWDLNLGPGAALERVAGVGDPCNYAFCLPFSRKDTRSNYNTSFAGLKTALKVLVERQKQELGVQELPQEIQQNIAASYQNACFQHVTNRLEKYYRHFPLEREYPLVVSGGVASNSKLRAMLQEKAPKVIFPPSELCTDNAVMICWAAYERFLHQEGKSSDNLDALDIRPRWPIDTLE